MTQPGGLGPNRTPTYVRVMELIGDTSWMEHGRCRRPGMDPMHWTRNIDKTNASKEMRQLAVYQCRLCPVQWECTDFAILTEDEWNVCGVEAADRAFLKSHPHWSDLLEMAHEARINVHQLIEQLQAARETA